jgi:hypothetical protein
MITMRKTFQRLFENKVLKNREYNVYRFCNLWEIQVYLNNATLYNTRTPLFFRMYTLPRHNLVVFEGLKTQGHERGDL